MRKLTEEEVKELRTYKTKDNGEELYWDRLAEIYSDDIEALDRIGMVWDVPDYLWEEYYLACMHYFRKYGNLNIPVQYISPKGLRIGAWVRRQRDIRNGHKCGADLSDDQVWRLEAIGMIWEDAYTAA